MDLRPLSWHLGLISSKIDYDKISKLKTTLKHLTAILTHQPVTECRIFYLGLRKVEEMTHTDSEIAISFHPLNLGQPIMIPAYLDAQIRSQYNPSDFYGYSWVIDDPIGLYAVDYYHKHYYKFNLDDVMVKNGWVTLKTDPDELDDLISLAETLVQTNHFVDPSNDLVLAAAYLELSTAFEGKAISYIRPIVHQSGYRDAIHDVATWYRLAAQEILQGQLPWCNLYIKTQPNDIIKSAYRKLSRQFPSIDPSQIRFVESSGMSQQLISVRLGSYNQLSVFKSILKSDPIDITSSRDLKPPGVDFVTIRNDKSTKTLIQIDTNNLTPIPEYNSPFYRHQYVKSQLKTNLIIEGSNSTDYYRREWLKGKLWSRWAQNYYAATAYLSRLILAKSGL